MATVACTCGMRLAAGLLRCPRCKAVSPMYANRVRPASVELSGERTATVAVSDGPDDLTFKQLRAIAKARGLSAGGTAAELAARISAHDAAEGGAP